MPTKEDVLEERQTKIPEQHEYELVLYNDDVNTFDHVIETLVRVCSHTYEQAQQCALIVHYKGKCAVMHGAFAELEHPCKLLIDTGLSAKIE